MTTKWSNFSITPGATQEKKSRQPRMGLNFCECNNIVRHPSGSTQVLFNFSNLMIAFDETEIFDFSAGIT